MASRRTLRVARMIKEIVSRVLMFELADPRMGFVTVTEVDVAPDMKKATVKISIMGDEKKAALCLRAVQHALPRLQRDVAGGLSMKVVPRLSFELDETVKKSVEISRLISKAVSEDEARLEELGRDGETGGGQEEQ